MLFNSYGFLLLFLPLTVAGFFLLARRSQFAAAAWLALASLVFYGWWEVRYIPLLLASICANYGCGWRIGHADTMRTRKRWLVAAIAANLLLLGYYKYANFFLASSASLTGWALPSLDIVLPIGISFFTFTQIAFLVDTYQGKVQEYRFVHYVLFVTYFPHLIAGPVLHHKEMMPQFADSANYRARTGNFAVGLTIFCIGLAKKVLIADNLAPYANDLFATPQAPSLLIAWGGVLAYAFQLYFDFSGYSDMAIGLSRLFGVRLPLNFDSPYKSASISEFWRRWHMTLSRFLRDYLYFPLGGNRHGRVRRYLNLLITMLLGGLWHGAGWNFVIWGGLHGVYLVVNHAWTALAARLRLPVHGETWRIAATILTFIAVCFAWVFFRATDLPSALNIVTGMLGSHGIALPDAIASRLGPLEPHLANAGVSVYLGGGARFIETWAWVAFATAIAFGLPNTQELMRRHAPALDFTGERIGLAVWHSFWTPSASWALGIALLGAASMLALNRPTEFLYFQF